MTISQRYIRNLDALSEKDCICLSEKRVAVIGCGGLGGYAVEMLGRVGVGSITVVDPDTFEESNLNRQLLCNVGNLGTPKVEACALRMAQVNPSVQITAIQAALSAQNADGIIADCDCVVDALDSIATRRILADACKRNRIPWVFGGIAGWHGQVSVVWPDDDTADTLLPDDDAEGFPPSDDGDAASTSRHCGQPPFTPACIASIQVAETIKVLLQRPEAMRASVLFVDLLAGRTESVEL